MKSLIAIFALTLAFVGSHALAAGRTCIGCKELLALKPKFQETVGKPTATHYPEVEKVAAGFAKLKRQADGTLDKQQIETLIQMLGIETDREYRQLLVEKNITLFKDNREQIAQAVKKDSQAPRADVLKDVDIVIREYAVGQDPPPEKPAAATPKKDQK